VTAKAAQPCSAAFFHRQGIRRSSPVTVAAFSQRQGTQVASRRARRLPPRNQGGVMLVKSAAVAGPVARPAHTQESQRASRSAIRQTSRVIKDERPGLTFERYFTRQGVDP